MIRRLRIEWPDPRPFAARDGRPIRWLAVSDQEEPALDFDANRTALGRLDAIVGAGDLPPDYLGFLADAFRVPLLYVRGNHDHGGRWLESVRALSAAELPSGSIQDIDGLPVLTLEWPGIRHDDRQRHDGTAVLDVMRLAAALLARRVTGRGGSAVVLSHAPPLGVGDGGDGKDDPYHVGFSAYRWLLDRVRPPLWLHGHVHPASVEAWRLDHDGTQVVNVTGAVLVEIVPPGTPLGGQLDGRDVQVEQVIATGDADANPSADRVRAEPPLEVGHALDRLAVDVEDEVAGADATRSGG